MTDRQPASSAKHCPPEIAVAVVDAETPGNVGTIARAMKNFGLSELLLVNPPELDPDGEAYGFAGQARTDILPNATELSLDELAEGYHTVACTAVPNEDPNNHIRYPAMEVGELADHLDGVTEPTAIVFGRERVGLTNEELAQLDALCSIPASETYPSLNLGQAATITLYELRELTVNSTQHPNALHRRAPKGEVERLHDQFAAYVDAVGHPEPKREKATRMFRRLLGRAHPTPRETSTLHGLLRRGTQWADGSHPAEDSSNESEREN